MTVVKAPRQQSENTRASEPEIERIIKDSLDGGLRSPSGSILAEHLSVANLMCALFFHFSLILVLVYCCMTFVKRNK